MSLNEKVMRIDVLAIRKVSQLYFWIKSLNCKRRKIAKRMNRLPKEGKGQDLYIILNGPSLKTQDLNRLNGKNLMFVNRGFMHPLYKELHPKYHVFVDSNLRDGRWPIKWVNQIFEMCPDIRIIFPIEWYSHPRFTHFKNDYRIFWQSKRVPFYVLGVSGSCFSYGISQKFDNIYLTGFDGNGCAYDLIKSPESHFYGADPELSDMTTRQHALALYSTFLHFIDLNDFAEYCKKRKIHIYNMTKGGVLDMFPRVDLNNYSQNNH
jgi:hypothetical protein